MGEWALGSLGFLCVLCVLCGQKAVRDCPQFDARTGTLAAPPSRRFPRITALVDNQRPKQGTAR